MAEISVAMALQVEFRPLGGAMNNNTDHMTLEGGGANYSWGSGDTGGFITYGRKRITLILYSLINSSSHGSKENSLS